MSKGMKFLQNVMLVFLLILCAVAALVVIVHATGSKDSDSEQPSAPANRAAEYEAESDVIRQTSNTNGMTWQRAGVINEADETSHFYPVIPSDANAGDLVVLSAPSYRFIHWDVDVAHASVDFIDSWTENGFENVTFFMPDTIPVIRAVYDDSPQELESMQVHNYEQSNNHIGFDYGDITMSSGVDWVLPEAMVGVMIAARPPEHLLPPLPDGGGRHRFFGHDFGDIPSAFGFDIDEFGLVGGRPTVSSIEANNGFSWMFSIRVESQTFEGTFYGETIIIAEIYVRELPTIRTQPNDPPDAMEGMPYSFQVLLTDYFPRISATWRFEHIPPASIIPDGLSIDPVTGIVSGTTTQVGLWPVRVHMQLRVNDPEDGRHGQTIGPERSVVLNINVLSAFSITPQPNPNSMDGMYRWPFNNNFNVLTATGISNPNFFVDWQIISDRGTGLPNGLELVFYTDVGEQFGRSDNGTAQAFIRNVGWHDSAINSTGPTEIGTFTVFVRLRILEYMPGEGVFSGIWREVGAVDEPFTITIHPQPSITSTTTMLEGMVGTIPSGSNEPPERQDFYTDRIEGDTSTFGIETTSWNMEIVGGNASLPSGTIFAQTPWESGNITGTISGIPEVSGVHEFDVRFAATDVVNLNMAGATTMPVQHEIRIWPRTYLHVTIEENMTVAHVRRLGETWLPADSSMYVAKRAIIPGTRGVITTVAMGADGFVRWEVVGGHSTSNAVTIGGPQNYGLMDPNLTYVAIDMPRMFNSDGSMMQGDVFIHGAHASPRPQITGNTQNGVIKEEYEAILRIPATAIGNGPRDVSWELVSGYLPRGLGILQGSSVSGIVGVPEETGDFHFTVGVNLPGTMRIERTFFLVIEETPPPLWGAVRGRDHVGFADLILLSNWFADNSLPIVRENANARGENRDPNLGDLMALAELFSRNHTD